MKNAKKIIAVVLLLTSIALFHSCSTDENLNFGNTSFRISTGAIYPAFDPTVKDYNITSLNTLNNIEITITDFNDVKPCFINNVRVTNEVTSLHLNPGDDIEIRMNDNTYTVHYMPQDLPGINVITNNNPSNGYILIALFQVTAIVGPSNSYLAILNNDGFPVYYKKVPYGTFNFQYFDTPNGKRFTYNTDYSAGKAIVMDEHFNEIKQLNLLPFNGHGSYPTDNHDLIYFDDNHYIIPTYYTREDVNMTAYGGAASVDLTEFLFQEIQNNQVIFEWDTADHPEFLAHTDPMYYAQYATSPKVDYFHFNSISIDPNDHNFIICARHTNQVYKVNRTTGAIMWRFGGSNDDFNLTGNQIISHPHHATILPNGNLLLFDNGVTKNPQQSRIAEFDLDETNMTANLVYQYTETGRYFDIMGSAQKLSNGNYFIGWGGHITSQVNANKSDITEVNASGNILLDISFSNNPNAFTYSYRALKYNINF